MTALYQLSSQFRALEALGADEIDEQTLRDTLEGLQGDITAKATNVALFTLNLEAWSQMTFDAAGKLLRRAQRLEHRAQALREYLLIHMQATGIKKIEAAEFTLSIRKNPPAVDIDPQAKLPERFMVAPPPPEPRPDRMAIAAALKAGETIAGARLIQLERLDIRA